MGCFYSFFLLLVVLLKVNTQDVVLSLEGGENEYEGRVVMEWGSVRGTLCSHGFNGQSAAVLCAMLNHTRNGCLVKSYTRNSVYNKVWMDQINCTGTERHIFDCLYEVNPTCRDETARDVGIICRPREKALDDAQNEERVNSESTTVGGPTTTSSDVTASPATLTVTSSDVTANPATPIVTSSDVTANPATPTVTSSDVTATPATPTVTSSDDSATPAGPSVNSSDVTATPATPTVTSSDDSTTPVGPSVNSSDDSATPAGPSVNSSDVTATPATPTVTSSDDSATPAGQTVNSSDDSATPATPTVNSSDDSATITTGEVTDPEMDSDLTTTPTTMVEKTTETPEYGAVPTENLFITDGGRGGIFTLNLTGGSQENITSIGLLDPRGIAYNEITQDLYYINVTLNSIYSHLINRTLVRLNIRTRKEHRFHLEGILMSRLALDPLNELLYYTSSLPRAIGVFTLDFRRHLVLINTNIIAHGIALNPVKGEMFWTSVNGSASYIGKARMDGSMRERIVTTGLARPTSVTVDIPGDSIYWCDRSRVESCRTDGSNRRVILGTSFGVFYYGIAVDNTFIYLSQQKTQRSTRFSVIRSRKNGLASRQTLGTIYPSYRQYSIALNSKSRYLMGKTVCSGPNNGGCYDKHLCIPTSVVSRVCVCAEGYIEHSNGLECKPNYTLALEGSSDGSHGSVVLTYLNQTGYVCFDNTVSNQVAKVVCKMLGFNDSEAATVEWHGGNSSFVWLERVYCDGSEDDIGACQHARWGNWSRCSTILGVTCTRLDYSVRLINGPDARRGQVMVSRAGKEGGMCYSPDPSLHRVICRMVGYIGEDISAQAYGRSDGEKLIHVERCTGTESSLEECDHRGWGYNTQCTQSLGVNCGQPHGVTVLLTGGKDRLHGRLAVVNWNTFGTVCNVNFTLNDARVICSMLQYNGPHVSLASYGAGKGRIWLQHLECTGNESTIMECGITSWGYPDSSCTHQQDVGINCGDEPDPQDPQVPQVPDSRGVYLVDGPDRLHGRLVVRHNGVNGTVCDDDFGVVDALVVCRMLGYQGSRSEILVTSRYGAGRGPIHLDDVRCTGTETDIRDCRHRGWGRHNCGHSEDVGIHCGPAIVFTPGNYSVRLVDGPDERHGRVVFTVDGEDGMICGIPASRNVARVVCRMLGYIGLGVSTQFYGRGEEKVWLEGVTCILGTESSILSCRHRGLGSSRYRCPQDLALGVNCGPIPGLRVRLDDGPDHLHGRVTVINNGTEGSICNDYFSLYDARVICRMLNYTGSITSVVTSSTYPGGNGFFWLDNLYCERTDRHLDDCTHRGWGIHDCTYDEAVGVHCGPVVGPSLTTVGPSVTTPSTSTPDLQLINGPDALHGILVLSVGGSQSHFCGSTYGYEEALVICRMLNYMGTDVSIASYGSGRLSVSGLAQNCVGNETSLFDCDLVAASNCNEDNAYIGVSCGDIDVPVVRLVDGVDQYHGRVEMVQDGSIMTFCAVYFTINDARVICRMLGYTGSDIEMTSYGPGEGEVVERLGCNGIETSITQCHLHSTPTTSGTCHHVSDVGLHCGPTPRPNVTVHVEGGVDGLHGRVVLGVDREGTIINGTICDQSIVYGAPQDAVAKVICRMLGYQGEEVEAWKIAGGSGHHWLTHIACNGTESSIVDCHNMGLGVDVYVTKCDHKHDLAVNCGQLPAKYMKVELVEGWDRLHGRVQLTYQNIQGSICRKQFDSMDAAAVCRMVGYTGPNVSVSTAYPQGNGSVLLEDLKCGLEAPSLAACRHRGWGVTSQLCKTNMDVGLDCGPILNPEFSVSLRNGPDELHGEVVVNISNSTYYGSVCELGSLFGDEQHNVAKVICRSLGYMQDDVEAWSYPHDDTFLMSNIKCQGNERSLDECENPLPWGKVHADCSPRNTLCVSCGQVSDSLEVWTENGGDRYHGVVMLSYHGFNGTICAPGFSQNEARVICYMLGYRGPADEVRVSRDYGYGSTNHTLLDGLNCAGSEEDVLQCFHRGVGVHRPYTCQQQPAGVQCGPQLDTKPSKPSEPSKPSNSSNTGSCGVRRPVVEKIYGGDVARPGDWPWQVSLQTRGVHFCGGSIISTRWIITAAHCVSNSVLRSRTSILIGTHKSRSGGGRVVDMADVFIHPRFSRLYNRGYDIALIKVDAEMELSSTVGPVCLEPEGGIIPAGPCYITGWGRLHASTNTPDELREALYQIVNSTYCRRHSFFYPSLEICGGFHTFHRETCRGDSGGPLVCKRPDSDVYDVYGITSKGLDCGTSYAVYTNVSYFRQWIQTTIDNNP